MADSEPAEGIPSTVVWGIDSVAEALALAVGPLMRAIARQQKLIHEMSIQLDDLAAAVWAIDLSEE